MADILCILCLTQNDPPLETVAEAQIDGTLYCREHAVQLADTPRMRARMGARAQRLGRPAMPAQPVLPT